MIGRMLPGWVSTEEIFVSGQEDTLSGLFPEERVAVARAVPKRQREFADVRACARSALGRLGVAPVPLVPGHRGAPQWPEGVVGSMTHCDGYRAAAVARGTDAVGIGIDAEPAEPTPDGVLGVISLPTEREHLRALAAAHPQVAWDRLLFSAKESVFKVWYPLTSRELDFSEAEITIDADAGTFSARLLVEGPVLGGERLRGFTGRWAARRGLLATAVLLGTRPATGDSTGTGAGTAAHLPPGA
ncbi:4'-phosphopantetheinyl transferase family protein [Streptomyces nanshensis]|uniref:4'-phosphopantetheinyl transferase n=1 Tax=Streptomyces nanshensis TaxID=518642 RepID=A0A1E7KTX2_9ACTN|nr:4'-phosphopantetheinyl transferase [Streptomyces nanshensis]